MDEEEITINSVVAIREEHDRLQKYLTFLKMENLEYSMKCNRMENAIRNIEAVIKQNPQKLSDASDHLYGIFTECRTTKKIGNETLTPPPVPISNRRPSMKASPGKCNKAHIVKPHMVNGTILYIPTINLPRISEMQLINDNVRENSSQNDESVEENSNENDDSQEPGTSSSADLDDSNETSHMEDVAEASASRSPSHSTVLSGTFQEVKIFLNQISPESLQEHSRRSQNIQRRDTDLRSSPNRSRSSGCITKRRKRV